MKHEEDKATVIGLVTKTDETSKEVADTVRQLAEMTEREAYVGVAAVLIRHDGAVFCTSRGRGNRNMLLGAVTDLQYTIAKDGDGPAK